MGEPIDFDHLDRYVFGDKALLDEILTIFIDQVQSLIFQLVEEAEDEVWRHVAHTLKGASRGIGAFRLGDLAEEAERMVGPAGITPRARHVHLLRAAASEAVASARKRREQA